MKMKKDSITKIGFKEARKRFVIVSLPLSFFALLTIGVLLLGFFAPISLVLTVPFIVVPSFFSVAAINTIANNPNTHESYGFFIMFRAYFSQIFRGGYKVIIGFLKSLLVFMITAIILSLLLTNLILNKDPAYVDFINKVNMMTDANQILDEVNNFMNTNNNFKVVINVVSMSSMCTGLYMFIHHFAVNSIKYNYNFVATIPLPMSDLNVIFKHVLHKTKGKFYAQYYKAFWFLGIILIGGFAAGALLPFFFAENITTAQICITGIIGSFAVLLFFLPYFLNASQQMFLTQRNLYVDVLIDLSRKSLEEMKKNQAISEEKEKEIMSVIESQKIQNNDKDNDDNINE